MTNSPWQAIDGLMVAVDGPAGSGKGTVAAMLAAELELPMLESGLLYRFVAHAASLQGVSADDGAEAWRRLAPSLDKLEWRPAGIFVGGEDWTPLLRTEEVGALASRFAALPEVRDGLLAVQRQLAAGGCVMDGRDVGTVVLPGAQAKFFLTASVRERARRRWRQLQGQGAEVSLNAIATDVEARDKRDQERQHAPLCKASDAISIDSTTLSIDDVVDRMLAILERRRLIRARQDG
jgi:cytidylate kinase